MHEHAPRMSAQALIVARYGLSIRQLAALLEVSPTTLSRALKGERRIPPGVIPVVRALAGEEAARELGAALAEVGAT